MNHSMQRHDLQTDVWRRLTKTLSDELQRLRELNDHPKGEVETASIRGQIKAVKELLALQVSAGDKGAPTNASVFQPVEIGLD